MSKVALREGVVVELRSVAREVGSMEQLELLELEADCVAHVALMLDIAG